MVTGTYKENEIMFVENNLQMCNRELAHALDRTENSIRKYLSTNGIKRNADQLSQIKQRIGASQRGESNGNWKGGAKSNYYYKKRMMEKYPEKMRARQQVYRAKKSGKLIPEPCEICGSTGSIQAHHPDHSRPLAVLWYCRMHHREIENEGSLFSGSIKQTVN